MKKVIKQIKYHNSQICKPYLDSIKTMLIQNKSEGIQKTMNIRSYLLIVHEMITPNPEPQ